MSWWVNFWEGNPNLKVFPLFFRSFFWCSVSAKNNEAFFSWHLGTVTFGLASGPSPSLMEGMTSSNSLVGRPTKKPVPFRYPTRHLQTYIDLLDFFYQPESYYHSLRKVCFFFFPVFGMDLISSFFGWSLMEGFFFNGEASNPFCPLPPWIRMPSDSIKVQRRTIPLKTTRRRRGTNLRVSQSQSLNDFDVSNNFGGCSRSFLCKSLDNETFIGSMVVSNAPACPKIVACHKSLNQVFLQISNSRDWS